MDDLTYKPKKFCDTFVETFDFNLACDIAKVNKNQMLAKLYDSESDISVYIAGKMDVYSAANSFITADVIRYKLGQIVITGDNNNKIQAARLLLGYEDRPDKAEEFVKLIDLVKRNKNSGENT